MIPDISLVDCSIVYLSRNILKGLKGWFPLTSGEILYCTRLSGVLPPGSSECNVQVLKVPSACPSIAIINFQLLISYFANSKLNPETSPWFLWRWIPQFFWHSSWFWLSIPPWNLVLLPGSTAMLSLNTRHRFVVTNGRGRERAISISLWLTVHLFQRCSYIVESIYSKPWPLTSFTDTYATSPIACALQIDVCIQSAVDAKGPDGKGTPTCDQKGRAGSYCCEGPPVHYIALVFMSLFTSNVVSWRHGDTLLHLVSLADKPYFLMHRSRM